MKYLKLIEPTADLEIEHKQMLQEWLMTGERLIPFTLQYDTTNFQNYIARLDNCKKGIGLPESFVPNSTFWLVDENKEILGTTDIRHSLTKSLYNEGGHIGYGIRPSERKKGYATKILELVLVEAKKLQITKALITCDKDNIASKKVILKNNGVFYKENLLDGVIKLSFWIDL
jgi:predicted acetyltransferase